MFVMLHSSYFSSSDIIHTAVIDSFEIFICKLQCMQHWMLSLYHVMQRLLDCWFHVCNHTTVKSLWSRRLDANCYTYYLMTAVSLKICIFLLKLYFSLEEHIYGCLMLLIWLPLTASCIEHQRWVPRQFTLGLVYLRTCIINKLLLFVVAESFEAIWALSTDESTISQ